MFYQCPLLKLNIHIPTFQTCLIIEQLNRLRDYTKLCRYDLVRNLLLFFIIATAH